MCRCADFALIIRAISVLEGVALVGNPEFAIVDEAYPYIAKRLLTDESPRLQAALKYMVSTGRRHPSCSMLHDFCEGEYVVRPGCPVDLRQGRRV